MLVEAFRRLSEFGSLDAYRYVGFGSVYFSDFNLFHRALGFNEMISIEDAQEPAVKERFDFNAPFKCVKVLFGTSNSILPQLSWDVRSIVWLDYDGKLNSDVLSDVNLVASKLPSGSLLLISVNVAAFDESSTEDGKTLNTLETLQRNIGSDLVPAIYNSPRSLTGWGLAKACRLVIKNAIDETLKQRNGVLLQNNKMNYKQLFNFHYQDGAKMLTTGGIFTDDSHYRTLSSCAFDQLEFIKSDDEPYTINVPKLTYKEIRALDKVIPLGNEECKVPVPLGDVEKYQQVYRYFPHFAETEI